MASSYADHKSFSLSLFNHTYVCMHHVGSYLCIATYVETSNQSKHVTNYVCNLLTNNNKVHRKISMNIFSYTDIHSTVSDTLSSEGENTVIAGVGTG